MTSDTIPIAEAIKRLSDTSHNSSNRLTDLESKLAEIHNKLMQQNSETTDGTTNDSRSTMTNRIEAVHSETRQWQEETRTQLEKNEAQWTHLTKDVQSMRDELKKICNVILASQGTDNGNNETLEEQARTTQGNGNSTREIEQSTPTLSPQRSNPQHIQHGENERYESTRSRMTGQSTQTIVIPSTSSIPLFSGNISDNPRQFLIRVREYTETVNRWDDQLLLNGISQFLRDTALEWYCQLRTSCRKPYDWSEFTVLFLARFNSPIRRARQGEEWKKCKQEESETINEFIVRLCALLREQKPNENENDLVKHLLCKMRNNLLNMIGVSRCESLDEIILEAQKVEEILYQRSKQQRINVYSSEETQANFLSTSRGTEENQFEVQAMSAYKNGPSNSSYTRRNYGRTDGYASQCSNNRNEIVNNQQGGYSTYESKCSWCGREGP